MNTKLIFIVALVTLCFTVLTNCKEKENEQDCGCDAETKTSIYGFEGEYDAGYSLNDTKYLYDSLNRKYYEICNDSVVPKNVKLLCDSLIIAGLKPSVWVVVDGQIGASCHFGFSFGAETITITSIKLKE